MRETKQIKVTSVTDNQIEVLIEVTEALAHIFDHGRKYVMVRNVCFHGLGQILLKLC